jgi:hypothetical protein
MKFCRDCNFKIEKSIPGPDGRIITGIWFCKHEECADPVIGEALPCVRARQDQAFCGLNGRYFKVKEQPIEELRQDNNIIQLK